MNKLSRRFRQLFAKTSRQARQRRANRRLYSEQLEGRVLLASDVLHNDWYASDVNNNNSLEPLDALLVINELIGANSGVQGENSSRYYFDTNADGKLSPIDALIVINDLGDPDAEGPNGELVAYTPIALATEFLDAGRSGEFIFVENGSNDIIRIDDLRSELPTWEELGFAAGGSILISDSGSVDTADGYVDTDGENGVDTFLSNNGIFTILSVNGDDLTVEGNLITSLPANVDPDQPQFRSDTANFFRPIDQVAKNGTFQVGIIGEDLRTSVSGPSGLFSYGVDLNFDSDKVIANGSTPTAHNDFTNAQVALFDTAGQVDEWSAFFGGPTTAGVGLGQHLLTRTSFTATASGGVTLLATDPAEDLPAHDTLLLGSNTAVPEAMIIFNSLNITVTADALAVDDLANGQAVVTVSEGGAAVEVPVLENDTVSTGTKTITAVTQPAGGAAEGSVTFNASQLFYTPPASVSSPTDIMFTYTLGNGQGATDSATVTVRVNPVNDAPTITAPANVTATEDTLLNISGVSVADPDDNSLTVTLDVSNGTLAAGAQTGASLTLMGTPATVNSALSGLSYTPNANVDTSDTLAIEVSDGIAATVTSNVAIGITAVDDLTVLTVPNDQTVFLAEDLVFNAANSNAITLVDVDSTLSVTLSLDAAKDGNLAAGGQSGKSITLTGSASAVTTQLNGLIFSHTTTTPFDTTLTVTSVDGTTVSDSLLITVVPPTVPFAANNSFTLDEDAAVQTFDVLANDIAADNNTLAITQLDVDGQTVTVGNSATLATGVLALAGDGSNVTFTPTANANGNFNFTYTIVQSPDVGDVDANRVATVAVTVNPVNDAPTVVVPSAQTINEDSSLSLAGVSVADIDGDSLTVSVTSTSGSFALSNAGSVTSTSTATGITLNGSVSAINAAFGNLTYSPNLNFNGTDTLNVSVSDNNTGSASGSIGVTITAVNDDPTLMVPGSQQFFRDISNSFSSAFSVADVDAGTGDVRVTLTIGTGTLSVTETTNVQVANVTSGISLTGTVAAVNASLATLGYTGSTSGNFTLNAALNDLGNTGVGGGQDVTGTVAVEVLDFVPATIAGKVFTDFDGDKTEDADEMALGGITVTLTGTDFRGNAVSKTTTTRGDGTYSFTDVVPNQQGNPYVITQSLPSFFQANGSTLNVDVSLQGQTTATGGLSSGNLQDPFADIWSRFVFGVGSPNRDLNSGVVFGFNGSSQAFHSVDGNGWSSSQFSNFRLSVNADGDSAVLTVFDSVAGADRSTTVSVAAGTLSHFGTGNDEIYRVIGSSAILAGVSATGNGEGNAEFAAAADDIFSRLGL